MVFEKTSGGKHVTRAGSHHYDGFSDDKTMMAKALSQVFQLMVAQFACECCLAIALGRRIDFSISRIRVC